MTLFDKLTVKGEPRFSPLLLLDNRQAQWERHLTITRLHTRARVTYSLDHDPLSPAR